MDPLETKKNNQVMRSSSKARLWLFLTIAVIEIALILFVIVNRTSFSNLIGLNNRLDFDQLVVTNGFHNIALQNGQSWKISYEQNREVTYTGIVRHTSPIRMKAFVILTRDILVTSGDFANPEFVETSVVDHHFSWRSLSGATPGGQINLFHTVPMNDDVIQMLESVKNGETITIKGWEIEQIEGWDESGKYIGYWTDTGCNTFLVTDVQIKKAK
jgi:hypothetical protein